MQAIQNLRDQRLSKKLSISDLKRHESLHWLNKKIFKNKSPQNQNCFRKEYSSFKNLRPLNNEKISIKQRLQKMERKIEQLIENKNQNIFSLSKIRRMENYINDFQQTRRNNKQLNKIPENTSFLQKQQIPKNTKPLQQQVISYKKNQQKDDELNELKLTITNALSQKMIELPFYRHDYKQVPVQKHRQNKKPAFFQIFQNKNNKNTVNSVQKQAKFGNSQYLNQMRRISGNYHNLNFCQLENNYKVSPSNLFCNFNCFKKEDKKLTRLFSKNL